MRGRIPRAAILLAAVIVAVLAGLVGTMAAMNLIGPTHGPPAPGNPRFVEETRSSGLNHTYGGSSDFEAGGGVAVFDCNADGKPDLFLAGGGNPAALYRNDSPIGGALRFTRLANPATDLTDVTGAYPLDIDGDGMVDLVLLRNGENILLRGLGGCRFQRANERWGFKGGNASTMAFSATWERDVGLPTLAFGNYVRPELIDPHHLCYDNELVRPAPSGERYGEPLPLKPSWCALSMLFSDWDRSGRRDLRVSNDRHYYLPDEGQEQLWRIVPGQPPQLYTQAEGWQLVQVEGMGIASYDMNGDGYPEYYLTSQAANRLQELARGPSRPTYQELGFQVGVTASQPFTGGDTRPSTAWHPEFADVNNDGYVDLFVSKGNVEEQPDYAQRDPSNLFLGQPDGKFREIADLAGILNYDRGRGAALADFNMDGLLDLVEVNYGAATRLWRNVGTGTAMQAGPMGNWIGLQLQEAGSNRDAIGAWIEVRIGDKIVQREVTVGGGHSGGQLGWIHFGLGTADGADVRVEWPDGAKSDWMPITANGFSTVLRGATSRGAAIIRPWSSGGG